MRNPPTSRFQATRIAMRVLTMLVALCFCLPVGADSGSEAAVKTAFLYNFFKFIDWPTPAGNTDSFQLCIAGAPNLESGLAVLSGKSVGDKALKVVVDPDEAVLKQCQILYLGERENVGERLRANKGLPIVTVSDQPGFIDRGGIIGFVEADNRLGFEINLETANKNGVHINVPLLKLAQRVIGGR